MAHDHRRHEHHAADEPVAYYRSGELVTIPPLWKTAISRLAFPLLAVLSRERSLKLGLVPLDDERVIAALKQVRGRLLDIGCGSNLLVRSYGNGVGVDVFPWQGCDLVIEDAARLPFAEGEFDTVSYLACLNHIPNREASLVDARRVLKDGGRIVITMIGPRLGAFIHRLRHANDPDHKQRDIDEEHELLGMSDAQVEAALASAGLRLVSKSSFVFGLNHIYVAEKA